MDDKHMKFLQRVLRMRHSAVCQGHYGPFVLFVSSNYEPLLRERYAPNIVGMPPRTLHQRALEVEGMRTVTVDYMLEPDTMLLYSEVSHDRRDVEVDGAHPSPGG